MLCFLIIVTKAGQLLLLEYGAKVRLYFEWTSIYGIIFVIYKIMACNTCAKPTNTDFGGLINKKDF